MSDRDADLPTHVQATPAQDTGSALITIGVLVLVVLALWNLLLGGPPRVFWFVTAFVLMIGAFVLVEGS